VQDEQLVPQWYVSAIERFYIRTYDASVLLIQSVERFYARLNTVNTECREVLRTS